MTYDMRIQAEEQEMRQQNPPANWIGEAWAEKMDGKSSKESDEISTSSSAVESEDESLDGAPTKGWPQIIGSGDRAGYIYKWAGNVAHLDDSNMVRN